MNTEFTVKRDIAKVLYELAKSDREIMNELKKITQSTPPAEDWFTASQVIDLLGITHSTLNRCMSEGRLPYSRLGKKLMFHQKDVLAQLDRNDKRS